jgi:CheY-like chemotaxis protein
MKIPLRVLIIEDSEDDAALLVRELHRGGYEVTFERVDTPAGLLGAFEREWDLVLCDYSMPYFSGADALRAFRSRGFTAPFIFVSGHITEERATALKKEAQDYVMKGKVECLLSAIRRELQKVAEGTAENFRVSNGGSTESDSNQIRK